MCIRDRAYAARDSDDTEFQAALARVITPDSAILKSEPAACLLYTSDAADERSSVDLGGRRIIQTKTTRDLAECELVQSTHDDDTDAETS